MSRVRWGLVPRGRRGENERSLEKRIEGVERVGFWKERMKGFVKSWTKQGGKHLVFKEG